MSNEVNLLLKDFKPEVLLKRPENIPAKPKYPVIDAHNHLFGDYSPEELLQVMDNAGVRMFVNVTGNATLPYENNCYTILRRDIGVFIDNYVKAYPGRFAALTMADFAQWNDPVLLKGDGDDFVKSCIAQLEADVERGACGLKVTKELGLFFKDSDENMLAVNDKRLFPIWQKAGELNIPVLIHTSDPVGFFLPIDEHNEHYPTLKEFPGWSFYGSHYSKWELIAQRDAMVAANPNTTFILPHVANNPEDLNYVANLMDSNPNVIIDFSARIDELGRQPYSARDFLIKYQDRVVFGLDMPLSREAYQCYFRFLETRDEYFEYPDYIGRWGNCRWRIYGLNLPDEVLRKIYFENAERIILK